VRQTGGAANYATKEPDRQSMILRRAINPVIRLGLALAFSAFFAQGVNASPVLVTDQEHKGILAVGPYQIFPENRLGNGVYLKNNLLVSSPKSTIVHILPLPQVGRFVYLAVFEDGQSEVGVRLGAGDPPPRLKKMADGIYFVVVVVQGVVYKKVYRVVQDNTIVDVLPRSKTADGMAPGNTGLLFYHVSGAETSEQDGKTIYQFSMRLHILMYEEERLRNLDYPVLNTLPRLKLSWKNDTSIQYTLADGRVEVLSTAQFQ
jgi:hypothetical protein